MTFFRLIISILLFVVIFQFVEVQEIADQLSEIDPLLYGIAILVYFLSIVIRALRWKLMLKPLGINKSLFYLTKLYILGFFWDTFMPTGFGGDIFKAFKISRETEQGVSAIASVIVERLVGLQGTALTAMVVILISPALVPTWVMLFITSLSATIFLGGFLLRCNFIDKFNKFFPFMKIVTNNKRVREFRDALTNYNGKILFLGILISLPFTLSIVLVNALLGASLNLHIALQYYLVFIPVVSVVNLLPLSFNGIGVREYMYQFLFSAAGVTIAPAVSMALAFNCIRILFGFIGGLLLPFR